MPGKGSCTASRSTVLKVVLFLEQASTYLWGIRKSFAKHIQAHNSTLKFVSKALSGCQGLGRVIFAHHLQSCLQRFDFLWLFPLLRVVFSLKWCRIGRCIDISEEIVGIIYRLFCSGYTFESFAKMLYIAPCMLWRSFQASPLPATEFSSQVESRILLGSKGTCGQRCISSSTFRIVEIQDTSGLAFSVSLKPWSVEADAGAGSSSSTTFLRSDNLVHLP